MTYPKAAIGDFVSITRAGIGPGEIRAGTPYVGLENIDGMGDFVDVRLVDSGELASAKFEFTRNHILFGKLRPYLKKTARPNFDGICSTDILPLQPSRQIDRDYLFHILRRQEFVDEVSSLCAGANLPRISPKVLMEMHVPVPKIAEQRRIAAILDKADALRAKRREAIAKLDQLLQSIFLAMFGNPVTNSKGWALAGLADVTEFQEGPGILAKDFRESGVPLIRMAGLNAGRVSLRGCNFVDNDMFMRKWQHFRLVEGDILVLTSASFGSSAVVDAEAAGGIFYTGIIRFKPSTDKVDANFLKSFLASMWFSRQANAMASGAVIKHFGPTHLRQMKMPVPPLALQNEYVRYAQRIEEMIASFKVSSLLADQLFESLQQRAFAGTL